MKLPSTSTHRACPAKLQRSRGFSFIEIMIVLAIIGVLATFGIIVGLDSYGRYNFHAESDNAVALLQKARSESINNIGGVAHGVHFPISGAPDPDNVVSFSGTYSYPAYEYKTAKNPTVTYTGTAEIIFDQLSGRVAGCPCTVTMNNGVQPASNITINYEGGIDY